jgi:hypothetical protein
MGFLQTITPAQFEAGRMLGLITMVVVIGVGFVPPLRPYAYRIRVATAAAYIVGALAFAIYVATVR